jgi:hypothetical protein
VGLLKIPIKKKASNKDKTLGVNLPGTPTPNGVHDAAEPSVPIPFIDRISVTVKVPEGEGAWLIHKGIWPQVEDPAVFMPAKKSPGYNSAWRLQLSSVINASHWPHFQYAYEGKVATGLRIEFVPVDLGPDGLMELHSILTSLVPNGWAYFIKHGRITRIDVAVDLPTARMDEFHMLPKQGATVKVWKSDGKLQTFQHGGVKGNHTQIYNRKAKRIAQGKPWAGKEGVRVERRLKNQQMPLMDLPSLSNPFASLTLVARHPLKPPKEANEYVWRLFLNAAEHMTLPAALDLLPVEKRTAYRAHLKTQAMKWWNVDAIWGHWPAMLHELGIASPSSWT